MPLANTSTSRRTWAVWIEENKETNETWAVAINTETLPETTSNLRRMLKQLKNNTQYALIEGLTIEQAKKRTETYDECEVCEDIDASEEEIEEHHCSKPKRHSGYNVAELPKHSIIEHPMNVKKMSREEIETHLNHLTWLRR